MQADMQEHAVHVNTSESMAHADHTQVHKSAHVH